MKQKVVERKAGAWLLSLLLLAGWLAQLHVLALPRPDKLTEFAREFLGAMHAIFYNGGYDEQVPGRVSGTEVVYKAGGPEQLKETLKRWIDEDLASQVVEKLQTQTDRIFDCYFE
jgi:hypothetical protein